MQAYWLYSYPWPRLVVLLLKLFARCLCVMPMKYIFFLFSGSHAFKMIFTKFSQDNLSWVSHMFNFKHFGEGTFVLKMLGHLLSLILQIYWRFLWDIFCTFFLPSRVPWGKDYPAGRKTLQSFPNGAGGVKCVWILRSLVLEWSLCHGTPWSGCLPDNVWQIF